MQNRYIVKVEKNILNKKKCDATKLGETTKI